MFISKKELETLRHFKDRVKTLEDKLSIWIPCDPKNPDPNSIRREDVIPILLRRIYALEDYLGVKFKDQKAIYEKPRYTKKGKYE